MSSTPSTCRARILTAKLAPLVAQHGATRETLREAANACQWAAAILPICDERSTDLAQALFALLSVYAPE